jgi:hypothetical protein
MAISDATTTSGSIGAYHFYALSVLLGRLSILSCPYFYFLPVRIEAYLYYVVMATL